MSSGGMDWAYRMIAAHKLDALGMAIVLHLGWRDAANFRTDRGIARALNKDRASVRRATEKLEALGVIARRSGQWVAGETVAIVEERPGAPKPDAEHADGGAGASGPRGRQAPAPGASGPLQRGREAPPMRKEKIEKARAKAKPSAQRQPHRLPPVGGGAAGDGAEVKAEGLNAWQRTCLREGKSVLVAGAMLKPGTADFQRLAREAGGMR